MSLTSQIVTGSQTAIDLIKNYLANPSIAPSINGLPKQDPTKIVVLECESYKEDLDSDISNQLIVDINVGKTWISDNIAPKPRVFNLKGLIGVAPYEKITSPVLQVTQAKALGFLREMRNSREMLVFNTKNQTESILVGISALSIDSDPLVQNRIPFTMTLKEIPILSYNDNNNLAIPSGSDNKASLASPLGTATVQTIVGVAGQAAQIVTDLISAIPVASNKSIKFMFPIPIPSSGNGVLNFTFNTKANGMYFAFNFKYTGSWDITVTMPDNSVRFAGLLPNVTQWSAYSDYGLYCNSTLDRVGLTDLDKVSLYLIQWTS